MKIYPLRVEYSTTFWLDEVGGIYAHHTTAELAGNTRKLRNGFGVFSV